MRSWRDQNTLTPGGDERDNLNEIMIHPERKYEVLELFSNFL